MSKPYPIGEANKPWQASHKQQWLSQQQIKRSYTNDVVTQIQQFADSFTIIEYGMLEYAQHTYPLFAIKTKDWQDHKPTILVTGGVHGYETSGVHGALAFVRDSAKPYETHFNIIVLPCISPWGYETINRWNPDAIDPNRSFYKNSPANESRLAMDFVQAHNHNMLCHVDLHETTDTDNSEFRPALAARDGIENHNWNIPDGFYLVGHTQKPQPDFQKAVITNVAKVTQIAPADEAGKLIGVPLEQFGVINYDGTALGLCMGMTDAPYVTTTEVYPDGAAATPQNCIDGQVAAVKGALDYLIEHNA
ncbi:MULTISPECIES: M14 family metallopeptidase [Pseudoalteromonas]|uniref:Peptidase n=1 Tax=Pseudoalteromonas amylolytica TaxID=1859457 RepID=A0A1S1MVV7_9GAMM|nr:MULTISPECIES: M14 family metallocarboxypeptidase [Pseudoalteromonas]OHU87797.1 peptidase [Pseudoalteromonas sp. JW3]OHU91237.1 peptidase [Pseudoalteromonas amylolytica]